MTDINQLGLVRTNHCPNCEAQAAEIERLSDLLRRNIDPDPCRLDHHGYCQTHYLEKNCSVAAARAALGETK
jgi:hypothetical protein